MKKINREWTLKDGITLKISGPHVSFELETQSLKYFKNQYISQIMPVNGLEPPFYRAIICKPEQSPQRKSIFCETRKGLMGIVRLEVAKFRNPGLGDVIRKLEGKMDLRDMFAEHFPIDVIKQHAMARDAALFNFPTGTQWQGSKVAVPFQGRAGKAKGGTINSQLTALQINAQKMKGLYIQELQAKQQALLAQAAASNPQILIRGGQMQDLLNPPTQRQPPGAESVGGVVAAIEPKKDSPISLAGLKKMLFGEDK